MKVKISLAGLPGVGKTQTLMKTIDILEKEGNVVGGILTEKVMDGKEAVGLKVLDWHSKTAIIFAHKSINSRIRIGKFGVDLKAFDQVAIPAIEWSKDNADVIIIDEVGKIEQESKPYTEIVKEVLELGQDDDTHTAQEGEEPAAPRSEEKGRRQEPGSDTDKQDTAPIQDCTASQGRGSLIIREGAVQIETLSSFEKGPGKISPGFYNRSMEVSRDLSVALLRSLEPGIALDSMAGTGIRGMRIAKETSWKVVLNDIDSRNVEIQRKNASLNSLDIETMRGDYFAAVSSRKWDYIDVDPYGTPSGLVDAAIMNLKNNGIIGVTMTDTANLEGKSTVKGLRIYGSMSMKRNIRKGDINKNFPEICHGKGCRSWKGRGTAFGPQGGSLHKSLCEIQERQQGR
jgi:N2,N2-dimethylguanosine tRNA methyltransferase